MQVLMTHLPIDVYNDELNTVLMVVPSPLHAIIEGGTLRTVCRRGLVVMDASGSFDPDQVNTDLQLV